MSNIFLLPNNKVDTKPILPNEAKDFAYYDFSERRKWLGLLSKHQTKLDNLKYSDPVGYEEVYEDVMEEWNYAVQDCFNPKEITKLLEKKYNFSRGVLNEFAKLNPSRINRDKFYFSYPRNKKGNLTQEIRKQIIESHPSVKEIDKILRDATADKNRFSIAIGANPDICPKYEFNPLLPLEVVAQALKRIANQERGQTASSKVILDQIEELNHFKISSLKTEKTIKLPVRGRSGYITDEVNGYLNESYFADGNYHFTPILIALERLKLIPNGAVKENITELKNLNGNYINHKPKKGILVYFGVKIGLQNSKKVLVYLEKHLSSVKNFYTEPKGAESLEPNFKKKFQALENWIIKNGGSLNPKKDHSYYRSNERQYLMWFTWKLSKDLKELSNKSHEQFNHKNIIWDHGSAQETQKAAEDMAKKFGVLGAPTVAVAGKSNHRHGTAADFKIQNLSSIMSIAKEDLPAEYQGQFDTLLDQQNLWRVGKGLSKISFLQLDWTKQPRTPVEEGKEHSYYWADDQAAASSVVGSGHLDVLQPQNQKLKDLIRDLFGIKKHKTSTNHWAEINSGTD